MHKVLVIQGPTAIGKTSFSLDVAKRYQGEIISGDSVQVYRGFNIGSGKIKEEEKRGIKHYLIDIKDYDEDYSIYDFQRDCRLLIEDISNRNKLAMIVGGSGLYLKSALYDYEFESEDIKDDPLDHMSNEVLYKKLQEVDPKSLEKIHLNNRRRLLRAYNYYLKNNKPMSESIGAQSHKALYDVLFIGLTCAREELYKRISKRVDLMIDEGLKDEVLDLYNRGCDFSYKPMQAIGYRQWEDYINKERSEAEVIEAIKKATRNFAKRQYTWFNHQTPITWFDISELDKAYDLIDRWLNE